MCVCVCGWVFEQDAAVAEAVAALDEAEAWLKEVSLKVQYSTTSTVFSQNSPPPPPARAHPTTRFCCCYNARRGAGFTHAHTRTHTHTHAHTRMHTHAHTHKCSLRQSNVSLCGRVFSCGCRVVVVGGQRLRHHLVAPER